jgi:hypothetical protein
LQSKDTLHIRVSQEEIAYVDESGLVTN